MNNNTKFKDCCDFITSKLPNIKCDFTNIKEIKVILHLCTFKTPR